MTDDESIYFVDQEHENLIKLNEKAKNDAIDNCLPIKKNSNRFKNIFLDESGQRYILNDNNKKEILEDPEFNKI